jgi:TonB family protein
MSKERKDKHFLHKPQYQGGPTALKQFISSNIQYPEEAIKSGVEGSVNLRYDINHKGVVTSAKIISGLGHGYDEEAIRLVKLLKFQIAKNRGVRATFHKTITIHFSKAKQKKAEVSPSPIVTNIQYNYTTSKDTRKDKIEEAPKQRASSGYSYNISIKK